MYEDCPICNHEDQYAVSCILKDLRRGKITFMEAATNLSVHPDILKEHLTNHVEQVETEETDPTDIISTINNVRKMVNSLNDWFIVVSANLSADKESVEMATKLAKAINDCLNTLAKIDGLIDTNDSSSKIAELERDFRIITDIISKEACPKCQKNLQEKIELML